MTILQIIILIAAILNISLGVLVLKRDPKSKVNITFAIFAFVGGLWVLMNFQSLYFSSNIFLTRLTYSTGAFLIGSTTGWILVFCPTKKLRPFSLSYFLVSYVTGFILFVLSLSSLVVKSHSGYTATGSLIQYGPVFSVFAFYGIFSLILWLVMLFYSFIKESGIKKNQIFFVLLGVFLFGGIGMFFSVILPLFGINDFTMLDSPCSLFLVGTSTYAIIKHRLWDIRLVLVKSLTYSFIILSLASIYIFIIYFVSDYFSSSLNISPNVTFVVAGLLIAFGFAPFKGLIEKVTDKIFFKERYNPSSLLRRLTEIMRSTLNLEALISSVTSFLKKEMKLINAKILLINLKNKKNQDKLINLVHNEDILVTDELPDPNKDKDFLRKQSIAVLVPLRLEKKLVGTLILSEKKSGDMYSLQDINFLLTLSSQLSVAINNALSFDEVLKDREKIRKLIQEKKELDKMKQEFAAMATNEIDSLNNFIQKSLLAALSGKLGTFNPKTKKFIQKAYQALERTQSLFKGISDASKLEQGKINFNFQDLNIEELINGVMKEFLPKFKKANLVLMYEKPTKALPKVFSDLWAVKTIISNLLENSLKFTKKGIVTITTKVEKNKIIIRVKDTGIGISKKKLPRIFDKFYQIDTSLTREAQGVGLGLYNVKLLLKLLREKIWVESQEGEGSRFSFSLPIKK